MTCTDTADFDGQVVACARDVDSDGNHEGMHISAEGAAWSPGMGIAAPHVAPETVPLSEAVAYVIAGYIEDVDDVCLARDEVVKLLRAAGYEADIEVSNPAKDWPVVVGE